MERQRISQPRFLRSVDGRQRHGLDLPRLVHHRLARPYSRGSPHPRPVWLRFPLWWWVPFLCLQGGRLMVRSCCAPAVCSPYGHSRCVRVRALLVCHSPLPNGVNSLWRCPPLPPPLRGMAPSACVHIWPCERGLAGQGCVYLLLLPAGLWRVPRRLSWWQVRHRRRLLSLTLVPPEFTSIFRGP